MFRFNAPKYLKSLNFQVETVIDIGIDQGTPFLYKAFPDRNFILIEPREVDENDILLDRDRYTIVNCALGAEDGEAELTLQDGRSSLLEKNFVGNVSGTRYLEPSEIGNLDTQKVKITTLDSVIASSGARGPYGIKIDVEGFEVEVLKGSVETLKSCEFVIAEIGIQHRFFGQPSFSDLVIFLAAHGFEFFNTLAEWKPDPEMYNVIFLPRDTKVGYINGKEDHPAHKMALSKNALREKKFADAARFADEAIALDPSRHAAHLRKGLVENARGNADAAALCFEAALACYRDFGDAHHELGRYYRKKKIIGKAVEHTRRAVKAMPERPKFLAEHGWALYEADQAEEAARVFDRTLLLDGRNWQALVGLSRLAEDAGRIGEAVALAVRAASISPRAKPQLKRLQRGG